MLVLGLGVVGVGLWMGLAPLSGAIVAQGAVKAETNRVTVQHQEGGIVKEILVKNGDRVRAGQPLIVLDDVRVDAAFELLRNQLVAERARMARFIAEKNLSPRIIFPDVLTARVSDPNVRETLEVEQSLFVTRRGVLYSQVKLLRTQILQTADEESALAAQVEAETKALALQREELESNEDLLRHGFVQKTRVLTLQRAVADYEARLGEHQAERAKVRQSMTELELRIITLRNNYAQTAADSQRESSNRVFEIEERLRPSRDAAQRQTISAPSRGEVVNMLVTSPGAVVGPREPLLDILPENALLIIEGRIHPVDINHVRVGGSVEIQLTAFKQRTTPHVEGKVIYVSADRLTDPVTNMPYYEMHVEPVADSLKAGGDLKLQAGMPAELFVKTGERTALEYLIEPVAVFLRRAAREP
jgi:HlyD family type I secretion membrane fusion protein